MAIASNENEALYLEGKEITREAKGFFGDATKLIAISPILVMTWAAASTALVVPEEPPEYYRRQIAEVNR